MQYYSLNGDAEKVSFETAAVRGQAPDKGLYFPIEIPKLRTDFIPYIHQYSKEEIGVEVMKPLVGDAIPLEKLYTIISETLDFDFPVVKINDKISSLELFHGPTLAFKDVGARFMSRCLGYFQRNNSKKTTVLVATSGDTGGAVANGFLGVDGIEVIILYPKGKVSPVQELQLTTLGQNIKALEVDGVFDDCQAMVKQAFMDADLHAAMQLTSANSINVARWLPQQLYYFLAYQQWMQRHEDAPVFCVPSGNFGNICAGIFANASGLPVSHFVAATNANDEFPKYLQSGTYASQKAVSTISNAMDVGDPSNLPRILQIFHQQLPALKSKVSSESISDNITRMTIKEVYQKYGYILDPHGAVAYRALANYQKESFLPGIILETAHPVKFPDVVEAEIGRKVVVPEAVAGLFDKQKTSIPISTDYAAFKEWLMDKR